MSGGAHDGSISYDRGRDEGHFQRRLRHLTSVQIRNLTPFPVRDAFASALSQPATHSQFTPLGNLSDDLDVTLLRRRSRRISNTSVNTLKGVTVEEADEARGRGEGRERRRAQSRVAFPGGSNVGLSPGLSRSLGTKTPPPAARHSRVRTASTVSSHGLSASFSSVAPANSVSSIVPVSTLYFDHSQRTLEKVIRSRLVETFITITTTELSPPSSSPPSINRQPKSRSDSILPSSPSGPINVPAQARSNGVRTSRSASIGATKALSTPATSGSRLSTSKGKLQPVTRQVSSSSPAAKITRGLSSVPMQRSSSQQPPPPSSIETSAFLQVPNYISPIHRPSTNPLFSLDGSSRSEFAEHTNLGAERLRIQLWAKVDLNVAFLGNAKGKQKESDDTGDVPGSPRWKVLEEWDFSLSDLIPLSPDLENRPSQLPTNALVMSFLPSGQSFHLPPPAWSRSRSQSRSPSPSGYNTDPESEGRKLVQSTEFVPSTSHDIIRNNQSLLGVFRRSRKLEARTASMDDLLQLVTLQASIQETQESLRDVIREIDVRLAKDRTLILQREASEREARIEDRRAETQAIIEGSNRLRDDLAKRRTQIQTQRDTLARAKALQVQEIAILSDRVTRLTEERNNLIAVRNRIPPVRTLLISTLATIYPIELLSPSELLFTILAVPLPIPFNPNDPAPPLSLSSHKEVTEESVAAALGYAAHLVQLLSVYTGKGLVYPITYIGSRSLIRDNISAMVGPRMFPLFSKGVDTYRFEYAVFLLNKDIEILMADRDLRALDMRHTLPNLKNLLLTLTDGECASVHNTRCGGSPSTVGLATPPLEESPPSASRTSETPEAGRSPCVCTAELPEELTVSSESGATTPKAGQGEGGTSTLSRYSKLSLGFPPLPGFFRSRNSTAIQQPATAEPAEEWREEMDAPSGSSEGGKAEDDDDRRTIKGDEQGEKIGDATSVTSVVAVDSIV